MSKFNNGKGFHGSSHVQNGGLKGATDQTDYFYFFCPICPDDQIVRILEYGVHEQSDENPYNDQYKSKAKIGFTLAFKIHCESCAHKDFVKISNTGWQGGKHENTLR